MIDWNTAFREESTELNDFCNENGIERYHTGGGIFAYSKKVSGLDTGRWLFVTDEFNLPKTPDDHVVGHLDISLVEDVNYDDLSDFCHSLDIENSEYVDEQYFEFRDMSFEDILQSIQVFEDKLNEWLEYYNNSASIFELTDLLRSFGGTGTINAINEINSKKYKYINALNKANNIANSFNNSFTAKGSNGNYIKVYIYGVNDFSVWITHDLKDDTSGASTRGTAKDIIDEFYDSEDGKLIFELTMRLAQGSRGARK